MKNTINRQQLQVILNRMTKKDSASFLGVSPSTIYRWMRKDEKGNYVLKRINTVKDYSEPIELFKKDYGKKRTNKTITAKKKFNDKFLQGRPVGKEHFQYTNTTHYYYEFSGLFPELITRKIHQLIEENIYQDINYTVCFLKLQVEMEELIIDNRESEEDFKEKEFISTASRVVHLFNKKTKKHDTLDKEIEELFIEASKIKYDKYTIIRIKKVILVEKYIEI